MSADADFPLPLQEAVRDLFGDLLSRGCAVDKAEDKLAFSAEVPAVVASYRTEEGDVAGIALADLPFACRAGSALVMMPSNVAEEAIASEELDGDMQDCFNEVANVLARLLNSANTPHVKLDRTYRVGELLPGQIRALLRGDHARRRDYVVSIREYGEGRLTIISRQAAAAAA